MQTMYLINPSQGRERRWRLTYTDARSVLACSYEVKRLPGCLPVFGSSFFVVGVIFLADNREANKWHEWEGPFDKETRETSTWAAMCAETDDEWCGRWTRSAQAGGYGLSLASLAQKPVGARGPLGQIELAIDFKEMDWLRRSTRFCRHHQR